MREPQGKAEVLEHVRATHQPLDDMLASLDDVQMTRPGVNGEWSVKDMLAHITWWERHLLRRLRTGADDLYVPDMPVADVRAVTDKANAETFAANRARSVADVLADYSASYAEVLATLEAMPEQEFADADIIEAIGIDTFGHYPEHVEALRSWLDAGASR